MPTLTEFKIEEFAIGLLQSEGYRYLYGPDIAPDGPNAQRASFEDVVLINSLRESVYKINHGWLHWLWLELPSQVSPLSRYPARLA